MADSTPTTAQQPVGATPAPTVEDTKPINCLVVDTGPLIKNDPPVSTLLARASELWTLPSVLDEVRDEATRIRVETTLKPFLNLRSPKPESVKFVSDFARRTGDLQVLSRPDIHLIALTYELECERNGGDWRLRNMPGQKTLNGKSPAQIEKEKQAAAENGDEANGTEEKAAEDATLQEGAEKTEESEATPTIPQEVVTHQIGSLSLDEQQPPPAATTTTESPTAQEEQQKEGEPTQQQQQQQQNEEATPAAENDDNDDDDSDGGGEWITPSNLPKHQAKDRQLHAADKPIQTTLQAALLTSDFAMQNVSLRINLNLVSPQLARITRCKTWIQRCHGCFRTTRDMAKQFCPSCGQPTLTRVACSTDQRTGEFTVHLKKNFQWNKRGNVYSVPKPTHGSASGKGKGVEGGGKGGWGKELILAEDQKEYLKKRADGEREARAAQRGLMDEDYLPGILTGDRKGGGGGGGGKGGPRIQVGAGRNVNSKKRSGR